MPSLQPPWTMALPTQVSKMSVVCDEERMMINCAKSPTTLDNGVTYTHTQVSKMSVVCDEERMLINCAKSPTTLDDGVTYTHT